MIAAVLLSAASLAQTTPLTLPEPVFTPGAKHAWKLEAHLTRPIYETNSTWREFYAEAWGGILVCENGKGRTSECGFSDGYLYWGYQLTPVDKLHVSRIPFTGVIDVTWRKDGGIQSYDIRGVEPATWDVAANLLGKLHHSGNGVYRSEDARRIVGRDRLDEGVRSILVALDVEPGAGKAPPLRVKRLLLAFQRLQSMLGAAKIETTIQGVTEDAVGVHWQGEATTSRSAGAQGVATYSATMRFVGSGGYDLDDGWVDGTHLWVAMTRAADWFDFALSSYRATPYHPDQTPWPGPVPSPDGQ